MPLSAFLRGPTRGSISEATFDEVCPESEVKHVRLVTNHNIQWSHAKQVLNRPDRCIVVDDWLFSWKSVASLLISQAGFVHIAPLLLQLPRFPRYTRYLAQLPKIPQHPL